MKQLAIVINSFNRRELLECCLDALDRWVTAPDLDFRCKIYVFDPGSTDGSLQLLRARAEASSMIRLLVPGPSQNTSIAAGFNAGAQAGLEDEHRATHLLFYETDNIISSAEPVVLALAELDARPRLAACGFTVRYRNGRTAGVGMPFPTLRAFLVGNQISHFLQLERVSYRWEESARGRFSFVDVVFTSPLVVKAEAWKEAGGMDYDNFPFSDCDVDLAKRLASEGWTMGVIERSDVIHDNQSSLSEWSRYRAMNFHRARLRYFKRYRPRSVFAVWPSLLMLRHAMELLAASLFVRDKARRSKLMQQFLDLLRRCLRHYA